MKVQEGIAIPRENTVYLFFNFYAIVLPLFIGSGA